jgi:hypothetical protein
MSLVSFSQERAAFKLGRQDSTTMAELSILIYHATAFSAKAGDDPVTHIQNLVAYFNSVMNNTNIPLRLKSHCIEGRRIHQLYGIPDSAQDKQFCGRSL